MPALTAFILLLLSTLAPLTQAAAAGASLRVLWSKPVPAERRSGELILADRIRNADGSIGFKISGGLLTAPDESGPGPVTPWGTTNGQVLAIAQGKENTFWLGGLANQRSYVPGGDIANAYLAKIDGQGRLIAEHTYKSWLGFRGIRDLLPLDSGDVVVADNGWVAKISGKGKILWERTFKYVKTIALSRMGGQIIVATIEGDMAGGRAKYRDDVVLRILDTDGNTLAERAIRSGINIHKTEHFGNLQIAESDGAVYVASNWTDLFDAKPIEISKVSGNGDIIWRKELAHSIAKSHSTTWESCKQAQTVLADGALLVACAIGDETFISRLDPKSGELNVQSVALPACHQSRPARLFLTQRKNGKVWLFGSRPGNNVGASCTWLAELTFD